MPLNSEGPKCTRVASKPADGKARRSLCVRARVPAEVRLSSTGVIHQHEGGRETLMGVRNNLRQGVWALTLALGMSITGGAVRAAAAPLFQDQAHDQDYSKNKR